MLVLLGYAVVFISVFGGFLISGGFLGALYQPAEILIIFGSAIGAYIAAHHGNDLKATLRALPSLLRGGGYKKEFTLELMGLLYQLMSKARRSGMMALEKDIDNPNESPIFSEFPNVLKQDLAIEFICDYLRLMVSGNMDVFKIESLMDHEIETYQDEAEVPAVGLAMMGDSLPAFGIVAAVLGVILALGAVGGEAAEIGPLIAHAMVGTFLGILLAYGFVNPISTRMSLQTEQTVKILQSIKSTLLANLMGYAPPLAIEFGRKALYSAERPTFIELEEYLRENKGR